jgi:RNA polymerase sigma-70 factor (ECF subfamily)
LKLEVSLEIGCWSLELPQMVLSSRCGSFGSRENRSAMSDCLEASDDFEQMVSLYYAALYRFAFSLTHSEADACDLTQQTFYIWARKGSQLRDRSKVKTWLFTTLHREFLNIRKRTVRFPHFELADSLEDLPVIAPEMVASIDGTRVIECLGQIQEPFQAALSLFYLEDYSYRQIAAILEVPIGTVRSRISRGITQLQRALLLSTAATALVGIDH